LEQNQRPNKLQNRADEFSIIPKQSAQTLCCAARVITTGTLLQKDVFKKQKQHDSNFAHPVKLTGILRTLIVGTEGSTRVLLSCRITTGLLARFFFFFFPDSSAD
jgi:hypothetical protein